MSEQVYLDYQATTPMDPLVQGAMAPYLADRFGNPHSITHKYGWEASGAVRKARSQVADFIGANDDEIVFTSGATESCNLAIRGVAKECNSLRNRIITVGTEHPAVLETVQDLGRSGHETIVLPVAGDGLLDLADLDRAVDERTLLVSIMAANNEIGVLQPLPEIAGMCHSRGVLLHTDATQAAGRVCIDVDLWGVDMLSLSAHKVYGPMGVGALFVRSGVRVQPIVTGGRQERGLRSGTVPAPLVVGFGMACQIALEQWDDDANRMSKLTWRLREGLQRVCPTIQIFGHLERRVPGNLCVGFPSLSADDVIEMVSSRLAISTGSACSSESAEPSRVLLALGLNHEIASTAVRISLGRFTNDEDIAIAMEALTDVADMARQI